MFMKLIFTNQELIRPNQKNRFSTNGAQPISLKLL